MPFLRASHAALSLALVGVLASPLTARAAGVEIIAHRGASHDAPENTVAAFELAWKQKADAIELDIYLTGDGKIVVIHDKDTKRTTGVPGLVAEKTLAELRKLDAGKWKGGAFAGQRLPTLEEALATVPAGKRIFIEVKCGPEVVPELRRTLKASGRPAAELVVISFSGAVVAAAKQALPDLQAYWIVGLGKEKESKWTAEALIEAARKYRADGLDLSAHPMVDAAFVKRMSEAKLPVYAWTVNDAAVARRLVEAGVIGITTDRPGWLREQLRK